MNPKDLAIAYDRLADRWNSTEFNRRNGISQHERALAFLREKHRALDVGCGCSGRIIDLLIAAGLDVEGVDISKRMIDLARARHPGISLYQADICEWELPRKYDFISAWDSIWHVPLASQEPVLRKLLDGLAPNGVLIFTTGGLDAPDEKTDSNMGPEVYYSVLGIPKMLQVLVEEDCVCRHLEYDQYPELHLFVIAQKREST